MQRSVGSKSIADLDGNEWAEPGPRAAPTFKRCYELRKTPISRLSPRDWRVLMGQDIGLEFLMPLAIEVVQKDPLLETEHYRGDLLAVVLRASSAFFEQRPDLRARVEGIAASLPAALDTLESADFDVSMEALEEAVADFDKSGRGI